MTPSTPSSFTDALDRSAHARQLQMWQAAQTVRAHVAVDAGQASMLECLGLTDCARPEPLA